MDKIITELTGYMYRIETFNKDMAQDGEALHSFLIELCNTMARANFLMAEYQREFRKQKRVAYTNMVASQVATEKYFAPSLAKDYVDAQCAEVGYVYDMAERLSRLCTHVMDCVRTIISSLKQERIFAQYGT